MSLEARLMEDLKTAMRDGDVERREAIRMLRAALKNAQIEKMGALNEVEETEVISRVVKRHRESIEQFTAGNRPDLVAHEETQLKALQPYLPTLMSRADIEAEVRAVLTAIDPSSARAQGQVMSALSGKLRGKADMKEVSAVVQTLLAEARA
ncbi:MAG: GatB/YqeY domain-containing protein [Chloroflexota bacterium]